MNFSSPAPAYWQPGMEQDPACVLSSDRCVIRGEAFFVRGLLEIPVVGRDEVFSWGVWVSLSEKNFERVSELWETPGRESEPPYFGWLSTELFPHSPSTVNLKTMVHTRPVGGRPFIELEPTDHPLAVEQRTGITVERDTRSPRQSCSPRADGTPPDTDHHSVTVPRLRLSDPGPASRS